MKNKQSLLAEFEKKYNKKFVCKRPFELVELDMWGNLYLCFPRCNNKSYKAGNLYEADFEDIVTSERAVEFKRSIIFSEYKYCDFANCQAPDAALQLSDELLFSPEDIVYPSELRLHIDNICDVRCIMCRNEYILNSKNESKFKEILIPRIVQMCRNAKVIFMNGNGEVFFSPLAKDLILAITTEYPDVKFDFCTNGIKCTKENIHSYNLDGRIKSISFSLHAITEHTYNQIVKGGNYKKLFENINYIKTLKEKGDIEGVTLNFVVTKLNYKEIPAFQKFVDDNHFSAFYSALVDNNVMNNYSDIAIKNPSEQEYKKLSAILNSDELSKSSVILDNELLEIKNNICNKRNNIFDLIIKKLLKK